MSLLFQASCPLFILFGVFRHVCVFRHVYQNTFWNFNFYVQLIGEGKMLTLPDVGIMPSGGDTEQLNSFDLGGTASY